jgi:hypothetical protein
MVTTTNGTNESTQLARRESTHAVAFRPKGIAISSLDDLKRFAMAAAASGFVAKGDNRDTAIAKAMMIVEYGAEVGIPPMASLQGIHIIEGKPSMGAGLISSIVKGSGTHDYRIIKSSDLGCALDWYERRGSSWEKIGESAFTLEEAKRAGLAGKHNWKSYPSDMCFARALSRGSRRYCPHLFRGSVYTPDEVSAGEVIEASFVEATTPDAAADPFEGETLPGDEVRDDEAERFAAILADAPSTKLLRDYEDYFDGHAESLSPEQLEVLAAWLKCRENIAYGRDEDHDVKAELVDRAKQLIAEHAT